MSDIVNRLLLLERKGYGPGNFMGTCREAAEELNRLRVALSWALGESPEGVPEFTPPEEKYHPYWWRKQLREMARGTP